ncbi:hypothetical protein FAZ69_26990 [Trinickia terrae]|uniref:Uncharacterized protein n=1 Tax=Trinickia terrae TaxID=2571161 RepID=A0A4U1HNF4_9BURK|nr:hypothetical protein [Trinickia terrae]TKC81618.1 hypothetical protein FAZ69_26990 [Trinickia terrae]
MKANRVRRRHMPRLLPLAVACCLGTFSSQPVSGVRFESAARYRPADALWLRLAGSERAPLMVRWVK